jgi:hypothetical protein
MIMLGEPRDITEPTFESSPVETPSEEEEFPF